jgi:hypothetical protein
VSAFHIAIQDFFAAERSGAYPEVQASFLAAREAAQQADANDANWALPYLAEMLANPDCRAGVFVAHLCERCMLQGGEPWIATGLIVERLAGVLADADRFYQVVQARLAEAGIQAGPEDEAFQEALAEPMRQAPQDAFAWGALMMMCLTARPLLEHFAAARLLLRSLPGALEQLARLAPVNPGAAALAELMQKATEEESQRNPGEAAAEALRELEAVAAANPLAHRDIRAAVQALLTALFCVPLGTRNEALRGLGALVGRCEVGLAGDLARRAGSLVEIGCDAALSAAPILGRLGEVLSLTADFVDACVAEGGAGADAGQVLDLLAKHGGSVAHRMPEAGRAGGSAEPLCLGAIAHLSRLPEQRRRLHGNGAFLDLTRRLSPVIDAAGFLAKMLRVLDDEELLVLSPPWQRGYRVRIGGIGDNFQLHTLLAGALVGPVEQGLLPGVVGTVEGSPEPQPGRPLDARAAGVARDLPCRHRESSVFSFLQLWNWTALQADGTLPGDVPGAHEHFIWNEGVPADIAAFEGTRVVLVGPAPFNRSWNGGRVFHGMHARFEVVEPLAPEAVAAWLGRIAAAR